MTVPVASLHPSLPKSEARFTDPSDRCPHPDRWSSTDEDSTEMEVSRLVAAFVTALQPDLVIETGTAWGQTAKAIGTALVVNGQGSLVTCEIDERRWHSARDRCHGLPVSVRQEPSSTLLPRLELKSVGFAWLDSLFPLRAAELRDITPAMIPGAIIGIHDCGDPDHAKFAGFSRDIANVADQLGYRRIHLPTPRGVTFLQAP